MYRTFFGLQGILFSPSRYNKNDVQFFFSPFKCIYSKKLSSTWSKTWQTVDTSITNQKRYWSKSNTLLTRWYWFWTEHEPILTAIIGSKNGTAYIRTVAAFIITIAATVIGCDAFTYRTTHTRFNKTAQCTKSISMWYAIQLPSSRVAFTFFVASTTVPAIQSFTAIRSWWTIYDCRR